MTPYIGEVRYFAGTFVPAGWQACDGSLLSISEYDTLFMLLGTQFGGDGQNTFAVPDLRSRLPVGQGQGPGLSSYVLAQMAGSESVTVQTVQMPTHDHAFIAQAAPATSDQPTNAFLAQPQNGGVMYLNPAGITPTDVVLAPDTIGVAGGSAPHENRMPSLASRYIISLLGIFPARN